MDARSRMYRSLVAEALGSFLYTFLFSGAIAAARLLTNRSLGVTPATLLVVALAHGFAFTVATIVITDVAPGHLNPAVTLALAIAHHFPWKPVLPQAAMQFIGAVLGAGAIFVVGGRRAITLGRAGSTSLSPHVSLLQGFAIEVLTAFSFMLVFIASRSNPKNTSAVSAVLGGLVLMTLTFTVGYATGSTINPARDLGADVVIKFFGQSVDWAAWLVVYLAAPIIGAAAAALLYSSLAQLPRGKVY